MAQSTWTSFGSAKRGVTPRDENPFRVLRGGSCWHFSTACTAASRQTRRADADDEPDELPDDDLLGALFRDKAPVSLRVVVEPDKD